MSVINNKRQDIFKDINPLEKIYGHSEVAHYIPAKKRK